MNPLIRAQKAAPIARKVVWRNEAQAIIGSYVLLCQYCPCLFQSLPGRLALLTIASSSLATAEIRMLCRSFQPRPRAKVTKRRRGSSRYMGLSWHRGVKKWAVQLRIHNKVGRWPCACFAISSAKCQLDVYHAMRSKSRAWKLLLTDQCLLTESTAGVFQERR